MSCPSYTFRSVHPEGAAPSTPINVPPAPFCASSGGNPSRDPQRDFRGSAPVEIAEGSPPKRHAFGKKGITSPRSPFGNNSVVSDAPTPNEDTPFWYGNEEPEHVRTVITAYAHLLKIVEGRRPKYSRRPEMFVGRVKRIPLFGEPSRPSPFIAVGSVGSNIPFEFGPTDDEIPSISDEDYENSLSRGESPLPTGAFQTADEVVIYQRDMVPLGFLMTPLSSHYYIVTWDRYDGIPSHFEKIKKREYSALKSRFDHHRLSVLYCRPVFDAKGEFVYSVEPSIGEVGYAATSKLFLTEDRHAEEDVDAGERRPLEHPAAKTEAETRGFNSNGADLLALQRAVSLDTENVLKQNPSPPSTSPRSPVDSGDGRDDNTDSESDDGDVDQLGDDTADGEDLFAHTAVDMYSVMICGASDADAVFQFDDFDVPTNSRRTTERHEGTSDDDEEDEDDEEQDDSVNEGFDDFPSGRLQRELPASTRPKKPTHSFEEDLGSLLASVNGAATALAPTAFCGTARSIGATAGSLMDYQVGGRVQRPGRT